MSAPLDDLNALLESGNLGTPDASVSAVAPMMPLPAPVLAPGPNLPTQATPQGPMAMPQRSHPPLMDILRTLAPVVGTFASGAHKGGFMEGFARGQQRAQETQQQKQQEDQQKKAQAEKFRMDVFDQAKGITDPQQWAQFVNLATESALHMGFIKDPSEMKSFLTYPAGLQEKQKQSDALAKLESLTKSGYDLEDLMTHNATVTLAGPNGVKQPYKVRDLITIAGSAPEINGQTVLPPKKADVNPSTDYARFLAKYAKDQGKTVETLSAADELAAKKAYGQADDKAVDPELLDMRKTLTQLQIDADRQRLQGSGPVADIQPTDKRFKIAQDLAYGRLTFPQFRTIYAYSRNTADKEAIYAKAGDLNPNFNPASFEMGFDLAKNPKVQQQLSALDNVDQGVADLLKFSDAAARSKVAVLNNLLLKGGLAIGGKTYSNFKTARTAFADELSGALGFGSATDMSRAMGFDMTDPNMPPDVFASNVKDVLIPFVARKRKSLLDQMGVYGQPGMNPAAGPKTPNGEPNRVYYDSNGNPIKGQ